MLTVRATDFDFNALCKFTHYIIVVSQCDPILSHICRCNIWTIVTAHDLAAAKRDLISVELTLIDSASSRVVTRGEHSVEALNTTHGDTSARPNCQTFCSLFRFIW